MNKQNYIQKVANSTGRSYAETKLTMDEAVERFQITYKEYYNNKLYELSYVRQSLEATKIIRKRERTNSRMNFVMAETGLSKSEIYDEINKLNEKSEVKITLALYSKYELYKFKDEALDNRLKALANRNKLKNSLTDSLSQINSGHLSYDDIQNSINEFTSLISYLLTENHKKELYERLLPSHIDLEYGSDEFERIVADLEATRLLMNFTITEYVMYHFSRKSWQEKNTFLSDKERSIILNTVNDQTKFDLLDNKHESYQLLKKYYKRKMLYLNSISDFPKFRRFCRKNSTFVVKPPFDRMGRGIKCITISKTTDLRSLFTSLLDEFNEVILEQLIKPHADIKRLNPDSVNTVRVVTYYEDGNTTIHLPFMKIGRQGSFVDNGGAGGILVAVDPKTGTLISDGIDELGIVYKKHPETGIEFKNYTLPNWNKAIALANKLSSKVPGIPYVGWDMTCTEKGEWIIVEGNAKTQFFGQQAPIGIGARMNLINTIHYKE